LGAEDVEVIVVDPQLDWADVARRARLVVPAAVGEEQGPVTAQERQAHLAAWRAAAAAATATLPGSWQQRAALAVWEASGPQDVLVLGSSSLVRDLEQHAGATSARVVANRGLAGIDGTTAMAGGLALAGEAEPGRVRLLVGDLTALHDLTGMLIGPEEPRSALDVVVVDDGGGSIFSGLEHAAAPPARLTRFFTTPHGADIAAAAAALGAQAHRVTSQSLPAAAPPALLRRFFTTPRGADIAAAAAALGAQAHRVTEESLPAALTAPADGMRVLVVQPTSSTDSWNS